MITSWRFELICTYTIYFTAESSNQLITYEKRMNQPSINRNNIYEQDTAQKHTRHHNFFYKNFESLSSVLFDDWRALWIASSRLMSSKRMMEMLRSGFLRVVRNESSDDCFFLIFWVQKFWLKCWMEGEEPEVVIRRYFLINRLYKLHTFFLPFSLFYHTESNSKTLGEWPIQTIFGTRHRT